MLPGDLLRRLLLSLALLTLAACGFRLAGTGNLSPELSRIQLVTQDFSRAQQNSLRERLQQAGVEVLAAAEDGAPRLVVTLREFPDRKVVTGGSSGKKVERITRGLDFRLIGADGSARGEPGSIIQQEDIAQDDDNLLSSGQERRNVIEDLEQALFSQLLRQLQRL